MIAQARRMSRYAASASTRIVITMTNRALDRVERDGLAGLVIGNDDPRMFTAGADLSMVLKLIQANDWKKLEDAVRIFQGTAQRIRQSLSCGIDPN